MEGCEWSLLTYASEVDLLCLCAQDPAHHTVPSEFRSVLKRGQWALMPVGIQETRGLAFLMGHSFLDQESAPVLTNKAYRAHCLSCMCTNLNWLKGKSTERDELLLTSQGFLCIFHCNIQGTGSRQWVGTIETSHLLLSAEVKKQWPEFFMQISFSLLLT